MQYLDINPHVKYGPSDKQGFMLVKLTPAKTSTMFVGLDNVRDAKSSVARRATFEVTEGKAGAHRTS